MHSLRSSAAAMIPRTSWFNSSAAAAEASKATLRALFAEDASINWAALRQAGEGSFDYPAHVAKLCSLQRFLDAFVVPTSGGALSSSGEREFRLAQPEDLLDLGNPFLVVKVLIEVATTCAVLAAAGSNASSGGGGDAPEAAPGPSPQGAFSFDEMSDKCLLALKLCCTRNPMREALVRAIDSKRFIDALLQSLQHLAPKQKCVVLTVLGSLTSAQPMFVLELCNGCGFSLLVDLERRCGVASSGSSGADGDEDDVGHDVTVLALQIITDTLRAVTKGRVETDKLHARTAATSPASSDLAAQIHSGSQVGVGRTAVTVSSDTHSDPSWQSAHIGHSGSYDRPHVVELSALVPIGGAAGATYGGGEPAVKGRAGSSDGGSSLTSRGLSMAVSFFNDFLRLTPLSASWLVSAKQQQSSGKEPELPAGLADDSLYFELFSVPAKVLEDERKHWSDWSAVRDSEPPLGLELPGFSDELPRSRASSRAADGPAAFTPLWSILATELHSQGAVEWLFDTAESTGDAAAASSALRGIFELQAEDSVAQKLLLTRQKTLCTNLVLLLSATAPAGAPFSSLVALLLSFIVESCCYREDTAAADCPLLPALPVCGSLVRNTAILAVIPELLRAGSEGALAAGCQVLYALLWSNALNIVTLEEFGVMPAFYSTLARIVTSGLPSQGRAPRSLASAQQAMGDMLDVLQLAAVITTERDKSCVTLLLHLSLVLSLDLECPRSAHRRSERAARCFNCETEAAHFECLHDTCLKGGSYCGLCTDCDAVFHKGSEKRGHVRAPIVADADALASAELLAGANRYCASAAAECHLFLVEASATRAHSGREGSAGLLLSMLRCLCASLDDRRARGLPQLQELMAPLLLVFRRSLLLPWPTGADPPMDQLPLDEEEREASSSTVKRLIVSQLVQLVPRVLLDVAAPLRQQAEVARYSAEQRKDVLKAFRTHGGDSVLAFLLLEQSGAARTRTVVSSAERQFIAWTLREALLCSIESGEGEPGASQESCSITLLKWLLWLVACPLAGEAELTEARAPAAIPPLGQLRNYLQPCGGDRGQGSRIPLSRARVLPDTRLFLLQELKLLLSGSVLDSVHDLSCIDASLSALPAAFQRVPIRSVAIPALSPAHKLDSRSNSFDLALLGKDADADALPGRDGDRQGSDHALVCRVLTAQTGVQSLLAAAGAVEVALHLVMGELCDPRIAAALTSRASPQGKGDGGASALAVEIWWAALSYLGHLVCGCLPAKQRIDAYAGAGVFAQALIPLTRSSVQLTDQPAAADRFAHNHCSEIVARLLVELCVDKGSVIAPCGLRNYIATSQRVPTSAPNPTLAQEAPLRSALADLITRPAVSSLRASTDLADLCQEYLGTNVSLVHIAPVYFVREDLLALQRPVVRPPPLRLRGRSALRLFKAETPLAPAAAARSSSPQQHSCAHGARNPGSSSRLNLLDGLEARRPWGGGIDSSALDDNFLNRKRVAALLGIPGMMSQAMDRGDSDMWEIDSVGGKAGSVHSTSLQSLRSLSQALRSATPTPGTSVNGDAQQHPSLLTLSAQQQRNTLPLRRQQSHGSSHTFISSAHNGSADPFSESLAIPLYYPMLAALNWGDNASIELVLKLLSEALLKRAHLAEPAEGEGESSDQPSGGAVDSPLITLRRQLLCFLPPINDRKMSTGVTLWQPHFSRLQVRSAEHAAILVSLAMVTREEVQAQTLWELSHLIDGNPRNADLFSRNRAMLVSIIRLLPSLDERPRTAFSYLMSQLLRHHVEDAVLEELVRSASAVNGRSLLDLIATAEDAGSAAGALAFADGARSKDDNSSQLLFIVGRCAERLSPHCFVHFDQGSALASKTALPRIDRLPPAKTGFTVASWMRIGSLGNAPTASLMQLSLQSAGGTARVDVFFRVVYRIHTGDVDTLSVASADVFSFDDSLGAPKRSLQLCLSFRPLHAQPGAPDDLWSSVAGQRLDADGCQEHASTLASSIASYSFPDAVVDLDWSEMGDWHLLALSFTDSGVRCWVDGRERLMQQWTALGLGYVPSFYAAWHYPSGACCLETMLGGLGSETCAYNTLLEAAAGGGAREEEVLLEAHRAMVGGFCGTVVDAVVFEGGCPDQAALERCVLLGPSAGVGPLLPRRLSAMALEGITKQSSKQQTERERVSSVFTIGLFSSSSEGDAPRQVDIQGSASLYRTSNLVDALRASRMGLKMFFPLLVADRGRQVAALRIVASIVAATTMHDAPLAGMRGFFKDVILYCTARANPQITTIETLQVLFDCGQVAAVTENGQYLRLLQASMLSLIVDIAVSLEARPALSRGAIDWLRELCDENVGNCRLVLQTVGVLPFLIIMSMWTLTAQQVGGSAEAAPGAGAAAASRAGRNPYANAEVYQAQQLVNEKTRLLLGCARLLKQLITGTTGIQTEPHAGGCTPTGFTAEHLGAMLSTVLLLAGQEGGASGKRGGSKKDAGDSGDSRRGRDKAPAAGGGAEQPDWALQACIAILDNVLSAADGPLFNAVLGMLNAAFPGNAFWMLLLSLLGNRHVEIRVRSLRLLYISLSSASGRPDPRLLAAFEQMQGFDLMAEQLAQYKADDSIVDALLALLFWSESCMPRPYGHAGLVDAEAEVPSEGAGKGEQAAEGALDGAARPADSSGVLTSMFGWRSGAAAGGSKGAVSEQDFSLPPEEPQLQTSPLRGISPPVLSPVAINSISKRLGSGDVDARQAKLLEKRKSNSRRSSLSKALPDTLSLDGTLLLPGSAESKLPEEAAGGDGGASSASSGDAIAVPQAIVPLLRLLCTPKDATMVERVCRLLVKCLKYDVAAMEPDSSLCAGKTRNAELLLSQKDWLLLLASCIAKLRRLIMYSDDMAEGRDAFSESESIGDFQHGSADAPGELSYFSSSEDSFDMRGDGASGLGHESASHCQSAGGKVAAMLASYTGPLLDLVQTLLLMVFSWKPASAAKYLSEIFLLSVPGTLEVQSIVLFDLLGSIESLTLRPTTASVNVLRNFLFVFGQLPEKTELSKDFCLQVLHVLHSLGYYSSPEIRQRMKETGVTELRNVFVCNFIFLHQLDLRMQRSYRSDQEAAKQLAAAGRGERVESLYLTVTSLKELEPSLVAYLSSTDSKLLTDSQVMYIVLGIFCDAVEDLDYISGVDPLSSEFSGIDVNYTLERVQMLLDALQILVGLLQCVANVSPDCRRHLLRVLQDLPGGASESMVSALVLAFQQKGSGHLDFSQQGYSSSWFTWSSANPNLQAALPVEVQLPPLVSADSDKSVLRSSSSSNSSGSGSSGGAQQSGSAPEPSQDVAEASQAMSPASKIERINTFLDWYCVVENSSLHAELRRRVGGNLKPIERQNEKHQEKLMQKRSKVLRALQERQTKIKQQAARQTREGLDRMSALVDKSCDQSCKDVREWARALGLRADSGRAEFGECIRAGREALAPPGPEAAPVSAALALFFQFESTNVSYSSLRRPGAGAGLALGADQTEVLDARRAFSEVLAYIPI